MMRSQSSTATVRAVVARFGAMPAFATATSMPPKRSTVAATAFSICSRSRTSASIPIALSPIWAADSIAICPSMSTTATEAPRACICRAVSKPMPRPAPVTNTTFPLRG